MTETDICNMALDLLKEAPITSIDDDWPVALWLKRNFATCRDGALTLANWNFAMRRESISADATAPEFGWSYRYLLPPECLRLVPLTYGGLSEGKPIPHEVEGGYILTNQTGPLPIRFVERTVDYDRYHPMFVEVLSARLGFRMAHWLTGKTSYQKVCADILRQALSDAWSVDAIEGDMPRPADDDWIDAR